MRSFDWDDAEKPVLTEEPADVEISFGGTVYFTCKAEGDPEPDIVWLYNKWGWYDRRFIPL